MHFRKGLFIDNAHYIELCYFLKLFNKTTSILWQYGYNQEFHNFSIIPISGHSWQLNLSSSCTVWSGCIDFFLKLSTVTYILWHHSLQQEKSIRSIQNSIAIIIPLPWYNSTPKTWSSWANHNWTMILQCSMLAKIYSWELVSSFSVAWAQFWKGF